MIPRFLEIERRLAELERRVGQIDSKAQQAGQSVAQAWAGPWGGGGGGGAADTFECPSIPAIAGGGSGTGNIYHLVGGSSVLVTAGATIYNPYGSATTAGRVCVVGANLDGSYTVIGQSCT